MSQRIADIQAKIGTTPDGFWGSKSIAACQAYLRSLDNGQNNWPSSDQASLTAFYGRAGDESKLVSLPVPILVSYEGSNVKTIRCHAKVADSLERILRQLGSAVPSPLVYDGCFNNRAMRGGSTPSLHARGAAIDLYADGNGNHVSWPVVATMPLVVMECFAREGWVCAGSAWGRDAMHFQATK